MERKKTILESFDLALGNLHRTFCEEEIHEKVLRAIEFTRQPFVRQFAVAGYRIDIYFPEKRLAIECDENCHKSSGYDNDVERTRIIQSELGNTWIRYDPYDKQFDVFKLISEIAGVLTLDDSKA